MSDDEYRQLLVQTEQRAQESFDKAVLTLSGGALAITFAFVTEFVPIDAAAAIWGLIAAWISWALAIACSLISHLTSAAALRANCAKLDSQIAEDVPHQKAETGTLDKVTGALNAGSGILFLLGVVLILVFVVKNVS